MPISSDAYLWISTVRAAHAGISLSEAEASIASPFTSRRPDISCVPDLIREGRAALVTSFGLFKFMCTYSLCQFLSVSILYWIGTNLADFQFLYIDLFLATLLAVTFGFTAAAREVSPYPAPQRMLSIKSIASIVAQIFVICAFQVFIFKFTEQQIWFTPFTFPGDTNNYDTYQGTSVFLLSLYQYVALILVYSKSHPHRRTVISNPWLMGWLAVSLSVSIWITLEPPEFLKTLLILKISPKMGYRYFILLLGIFNILVMILTEDYLIEFGLRVVMQTARKKIRCLKKEPPLYQKICEEIKFNPQAILYESNIDQHEMQLWQNLLLLFHKLWLNLG